LCDIWVLHDRQSLSLRLEARHNVFGVHPDLHELQRHTALDGLCLLGFVDDAHAAFSQHLQDPIRANSLRMTQDILSGQTILVGIDCAVVRILCDHLATSLQIGRPGQGGPLETAPENGYLMMMSGSITTV
jgi:hypothetical protein